jgi:hypothetical protein
MRRMSVGFAAAALIGLWGGAAAAPRVQTEAAPIEARRFQEALDRIGKASPVPGAPRRVEFSDNDLNVYIRHRIRQSKEDVLRDARVRLYKDNRIEGWFELDFSGRKIPAFIRKRMNLYFMGGIFVRDGFIRFEFKDIFLEKERVPLMMLDMIVFVASQLGKTDAKSVSEWHPLPPGIRDVRTSEGRFALFY